MNKDANRSEWQECGIGIHTILDAGIRYEIQIGSYPNRFELIARLMGQEKKQDYHRFSSYVIPSTLTPSRSI